MEFIDFILRGIAGGVAAIGFAILFNVPKRALLYIGFFGFLGVGSKLLLMRIGVDIVFSSLAGATFIGLFCLIAARNKNAPPLVFSIPSVIPLIPGVYTYKMMIGIIELVGSSGDRFIEIFSKTVSNGLTATFVILALAVGVSVPNLIFRKDSIHEITLLSRPKSKKNSN